MNRNTLNIDGCFKLLAAIINPRTHIRTKGIELRYPEISDLDSLPDKSWLNLASNFTELSVEEMEKVLKNDKN